MLIPMKRYEHSLVSFYGSTKDGIPLIRELCPFEDKMLPCQV